jgi:hypothetical protein
VGWAFNLKHVRELAALKLEVSKQEELLPAIEPVVVRAEKLSSISSTIQDPRSAKIYRQVAAIAALSTAQPGVVNDKLISAMRQTLGDNDPMRRARDFAVLLEQMRGIDAPTVHELFLELHAEGKAYAEYANFAGRWGEVDGEGAYQYLYNQRPMVFVYRDWRDIAIGWGMSRPQEAMDWMAGHQREAESFDGRVAVLRGWIRKNPQAATDWLESQHMHAEEASRCVSQVMTETIHTVGIRGACKWLAGMPKTPEFQVACAKGWVSASTSFNELSYANAAIVWGELGDQDWMSFENFKSFSDMVSRTRSAHEGVTGFYLELEKTWPEAKAIAKFEKWMKIEPQKVQDWARRAPSGAIRTAAIQAIVRHLQMEDPSAAAQWQMETSR